MKTAPMDHPVETNKPHIAWGDLGLILIGGSILLGLVLFDMVYPAYTVWTAPLRVLLGLFYVLHVPGYLLQVLLFAQAEDLDRVERIGLSLCLSVALVSLLALLLDSLPWGLRFWPIVIGQSGMVMLLLLLAAWRRTILSPGDLYVPDIRPHLRRYWAGLERIEQYLILAMGGTLLLAGLLAGWIFLVPSSDEFMTEFYILGKEGLAEHFPQQASVGESLQVTLGLNNLECEAKIYRVDVWVQDGWDEAHRQLIAAAGPVNLEPGQSIEEQLTWSMPWAGDDQVVDILLYLGAEPEPYRRLRMFLNVDS